MVERTRLQNLLLIFRAFFLGEFFSRKVTPEITSEVIFKRRKNTLNSNTKSYSEINCLPDPNHEETVPFQKPTLAQQTPLIIQTPHLDLPEQDSTNLTQNSSKLTTVSSSSIYKNTKINQLFFEKIQEPVPNHLQLLQDSVFPQFRYQP